MNIKMLKGYKGPLTVNGDMYSSAEDAIQDLHEYEGPLHVVINKHVVKRQTNRRSKRSVFKWIR